MYNYNINADQLFLNEHSKQILFNFIEVITKFFLKELLKILISKFC